MDIKIIGQVAETELCDSENVLELLNEKISCIIDEDLNSAQNDLVKKKVTLKKKKSDLDEIKKKMDDISSRYNREKQLSRVLTLIEKLKKEGAIRGHNRKIILKHIENLETLDFFKLRDVEEKLSILLPDTYGGK